MICEKSWLEKRARDIHNIGIGTILIPNVEDNHLYLKSIFDVIKFLVQNELPFVL